MVVTVFLRTYSPKYWECDKWECKTRFGINTANSVAAGVSSTADRTWSIRVMQVVGDLVAVKF